MKKIITLLFLAVTVCVNTADSQTWLDMASGLGTTGESVKAIGVAPDGTIYVGGTFTGAVSFLAKWNGNAWENVGTGVNGPVYAIGIKTSSDIYFGGEFTTAGGNAVSNIVRWNGTSFSDIGGGFNSKVKCIYVSSGSGSVYAGGEFSQSGSNTMNHISKLVGSSWTQLGSGISSTVNAITENSGTLYAGTEALMAPVKKFDGSAWSDVSGLSSGKVYALASYNNQLYAGGDFTTPSFAASRYDGTNWSTIVTTFSSADKIYTMLSRYGILYLGGKFSNLGIPGSQATNAARKMTSNNPIQSITVTASVLGDEVYAIGNQSGKVVAGGKFSSPNHVAITSTTIGLDEIQGLVTEYKLFPNPVQSTALIQVRTREFIANPYLQVFDLQSRKVDNLEVNYTAHGNDIEISFDCSSLAKGTYVFLLSSGEQPVLQDQFIVE